MRKQRSLYRRFRWRSHQSHRRKSERTVSRSWHQEYLGSTINFFLAYNSYNADGSRAQIDTVMGYGWTHSYNIFLFSQRGHMFRMDGNGRVIKYQLGAGGAFTTATGYFETLVKNPDGSFTLKQKDGTVFRFVFILNTPFLVGGPVYRLTTITDHTPTSPSSRLIVTFPPAGIAIWILAFKKDFVASPEECTFTLRPARR